MGASSGLGAALVIVGLNGKLVLDQIGEWVDALSTAGGRIGPIPVYWLGAGGLYAVAVAALLLLLWVTVKPFVRPSPAWLPKPSVKLNWTQLLRPRRLSRIGVALEHNANDAEILNRASVWRRARRSRAS